MSLPLPGAWIEIDSIKRAKDMILSLPLPGAWIEISMKHGKTAERPVAPFTGSVD